MIKTIIGLNIILLTNYSTELCKIMERSISLCCHLQELVYELEPANEEIPWLQKLFLDILETDVENCPLFPQHRINTFIRLACGLPPYLFFTNHPNECVTQQALQNFAMIINQWLKPHVTELGFFSKKLTQFLFNAIIRSDNADVVLKYIIVKCPIIVASVVCHFPLLSSSYSIRKNPYTEDFLRDLGMCFADISSICNQTCLPTELIGLQLYKSGLRNMLKAIERRLFSSEILQSATQFLVFNQVLQFSTSKPTKEWPLETLKQISESPSIIYFFKNKMEEEGFVAKVFNDRYISIYPLVCSMLMLQIFETETVEALPIDSRILTLQILLENLSLCEQFTDGMDIPPMAEHVISIASVSKRLIVIIANKIPTLILKAIPGEIWQKCDVPIQMTVHQRLQNG